MLKGQLSTAPSFTGVSSRTLVLWQIPMEYITLKKQSGCVSHTVVTLASYPGLLGPAFVTCSTNASDKRWGEKAWV